MPLHPHVNPPEKKQTEATHNNITLDITSIANLSPPVQNKSLVCLSVNIYAMRLQEKVNDEKGHEVEHRGSSRLLVAVFRYRDAKGVWNAIRNARIAVPSAASAY